MKIHTTSIRKEYLQLLVAVLFACSIFAGAIYYYDQMASEQKANNSTSVELGFSSLSPSGESGGEIIPASCPSDLHDDPLYGQACASACGYGGLYGCGGLCNAYMPSGYGASCTTYNSCGMTYPLQVVGPCYDSDKDGIDDACMGLVSPSDGTVQCNGACSGSYYPDSNCPSVVPPATPTGLSAVCPLPGTYASVSWTASANATYYQLRANNYSLPDISATTYGFSSNPGLSTNVWVSACNSAGCSAPTNQVLFTCIAPPPLPTGGINATDCTIPSGTSTCWSTVSWWSLNTTATDIRQNGFNFGTVPNNTTQRSIGIKTNGVSLFEIFDNGTFLGADTAAADCNSSSVWNGIICGPKSPVATITASNCTITSGNSTCTSNIVWTSSYTTAPSVYQDGTFVSNLPGGSTSVSITNGTHVFSILENTTSLDTTGATAQCDSSSVWDGFKCRAFACTGTLPSGGVAYSLQESTGLTADTQWHFSSTDTSGKCEFSSKCPLGQVWSGLACIAAIGPDLTVSKHLVEQGDSATLTWKLNNQFDCTLTGGGLNIPSINGDGAQNITVNGRAIYTLTCPVGQDSVTVEVIPHQFES